MNRGLLTVVVVAAELLYHTALALGFLFDDDVLDLRGVAGGYSMTALYVELVFPWRGNALLAWRRSQRALGVVLDVAVLGGLGRR